MIRTTRDLRAAWLTFTGRGKVTIGADPKIARGARYNLKNGGTITLGARCRLHFGSILVPGGGSIELGDDCSLNPYSILYGHGGLEIGNGVRIAKSCVIGAGLVVSKSTEPFGIYGGVPARLIKMRGTKAQPA